MTTPTTVTQGTAPPDSIAPAMITGDKRREEG